MPTSTPRLALAQPTGTDAPSEYRLAITANSATLDDSVLITSGTLVERPAAGTVGKVYYATDLGVWFDDDGTAWQPRQRGYPARGYKDTGTAIAGGGWSQFLIDVVTIDPASCFSSGAYVCPHAGYYAVSGQTAVTSTTATNMSTGILLNPPVGNPVSSSYAVSQGDVLSATGAGAILYTNVSDILSCAAGDKIVLGCYNGSSNAQTITVAPTVNYLAVQPICGG